MTGVFFVGDLHFGHAKVSEIRGFELPMYHDETIMEKWERQVNNGDLVYVMGDISVGSRDAELRALNLISSLPGRKVLISGNHDSISAIHRKVSPHLDKFHEVFEQIKDFGRIRVEGKDVMLSHYPYWGQGDGPGRTKPPRYAQYRLPDLGAPLIHAHTHHTDPFDGSFTGREMCVSWDAWGRLVTLGDVSKWVKELA